LPFPDFLVLDSSCPIDRGLDFFLFVSECWPLFLSQGDSTDLFVGYDLGFLLLSASVARRVLFSMRAINLVFLPVSRRIYGITLTHFPFSCLLLTLLSVPKAKEPPNFQVRPTLFVKTLEFSFFLYPGPVRG